MLRKLMKHEFRATGRVLLPLFGILLLAALAARFSVGFLLETDSWFLNLVGGLLTTAFGLAIFAVCLMALITMVNRFRTNLLGAEGYIMFTLPASVHQQIWSKLIVSASTLPKRLVKLSHSKIGISYSSFSSSWRRMSRSSSFPKPSSRISRRKASIRPSARRRFREWTRFASSVT